MISPSHSQPIEPEMIFPTILTPRSVAVVDMKVQSELLALLKGHCESLYYFAKTLWLFPVNDIKSMVIPTAIFALSTACSMRDGRTDEEQGRYMGLVFVRLPWVLSWTWMNLLAFTIGNQRTKQSIEEDQLNKPWRPIPSRRLTVEAANTLCWIAYLASFLTSAALGGLVPSLFLALFGFLYNDLGGANKHWSCRHVLNACGFMCFEAGALQVATSRPLSFDASAWLVVIGSVVASTIHTMDMYDQVGDAAANRRTLPLVIGDGTARVSIAVAVLVWSWACPSLWSASKAGYGLTMVLGLIVAGRTTCDRSVKGDRITSKIFNAWMAMLYLLLLLQAA